MLVYSFICKPSSGCELSFLEYIWGGIAGSRRNSIFNSILRKWQTVFHSSCIRLHFQPPMHYSPGFVRSSPALVILFLNTFHLLGAGACACICCGMRVEARESFGNWFSFSTMWAPAPEHKVSSPGCRCLFLMSHLACPCFSLCIAVVGNMKESLTGSFKTFNTYTKYI